MLNILATITASILTAIGSIFVVYNYLPLEKLELRQEISRLGATITTINGGDTISSSRTTINDNFTNLNNGKVENATTSMSSVTTLANLATVGTLTSGALGSGFTAINVAQGGIGSTTLSFGHILLGSTTNAIGIVEGFGSSGQLLTSNGANTAPTWQSPSVDTAIAYDWTGAHTFSRTVNASSSLMVNTQLSVATTAPALGYALAATGRALISGTSTVGGLIATSSLDVSSFSSSATSTFNAGIEIKSGCITGKSSTACLGYSFAYSTSTASLTAGTYDDERNIGFIPKALSGTAYLDVATNNDVICSFSWTADTGHVHYGAFVGGTGIEHQSDKVNLCKSDQATDDMTIKVQATSATSITIRYNVTGSGNAALVMNAIITGD